MILKSIHCTVWILIFTFLSLQAHAEKLSFRSDYYCPYVCDPQSIKPGYMVEILKQVFEKEGFKVDIKLTTWARAIKETRSNTAQGLIGSQIGDAPDFVFPAKPLGVAKNAFYTRKDSTWTYQGAPSLINVRVGIINGYWYGRSLDRFIKTRHKSFIPFSGEHPLEQALEKTQSKYLDAFIENPLVLQYLMMKKGLSVSTLKQAGWVPTKDNFLYVSFSPNNPKAKDYAQILSKGIEELRNNGELKVILAKYTLEDWDSTPQLATRSLDNFRPSFLESSLDLLNMLNARSL